MTLVLNTRPAEQAAELSALLGHAGFEVLEVPAIIVEPVRYVVVEGSYAWLVLQSQNAARFFPARRAARILCGAATARALDIAADITLDRFSAAAALDALRPHLEPGDGVLVPRTAEGRDDLVDGLRALGATVEAPVCYRTVGQPEAFANLPEFDVVTCCSPSAVRAVVDGLGLHRLNAVKIVCLGETTAEAAGSAGVRVDGVARRTSMPALVEAVFGALHGVAA